MDNEIQNCEFSTISTDDRIDNDNDTDLQTPTSNTPAPPQLTSHETEEINPYTTRTNCARKEDITHNNLPDPTPDTFNVPTHNRFALLRTSDEDTIRQNPCPAVAEEPVDRQTIGRRQVTEHKLEFDRACKLLAKMRREQDARKFKTFT